jgi:hypothetical protein
MTKRVTPTSLPLYDELLCLPGRILKEIARKENVHVSNRDAKDIGYSIIAQVKKSAIVKYLVRYANEQDDDKRKYPKLLSGMEHTTLLTEPGTELEAIENKIKRLAPADRIIVIQTGYTFSLNAEHIDHMKQGKLESIARVNSRNKIDGRNLNITIERHINPLPPSNVNVTEWKYSAVMSVGSNTNMILSHVSLKNRLNSDQTYIFCFVASSFWGLNDEIQYWTDKPPIWYFKFLLLAFRKESIYDCPMALLPFDIIKYIASFL